MDKIQNLKIKKSSSKKEPRTMADLLKTADAKIQSWKVGQVVQGTVIEKTGLAIYIDIGGKAEGMVIDREMKAARDFIKNLKIGDQVTAIVTQPENDRGQTLLSLKKAAQETLWQEFLTSQKTDQILKVRGLQVNKGGLVVEVKGVQGFIPASQFSMALAGKINDLADQEISVKVIEVNRATNRLIFSEKAVSEANLLAVHQKALSKIKVGQQYPGEISGILAFGLFVKLDIPKLDKAKIEGLVHISEISWEKIDDLEKQFKVGQKVKVQVLAIDQKTGKLNLSIKQLLVDPWQEIEKKYPADTKVKGEVIRQAPFGLFVNLEPGIEGLVHISKIPADKQFKVGQKISCFVESLDKENRRLSLGLVLTEKPVGYK